jgi:hypothetical protein
MFCYVVAQLTLVPFKDGWKPMGLAIEECKWPSFHRLLAQEPDRPLVLMLGSSRTCWAFNARCLDGLPGPDGRPLRVFNFGIPSAGPIHELLCLQDVLAEGIHPRLLLIELLPPLICEAQRGALTEESMTGFTSIRGRDFIRMMPYLTRPRRAARQWLEARFALWYAFRLEIQGELCNWAFGNPRQEYPAVDEWGWRMMIEVPFSTHERARRVEKAREGYQAGLRRFRLGSQPCKALHELFALCRREQIPTAVVLMPESSEFRSWYSAEAKIAIRGLLEDLNRIYDVSVIDAEKWLADEDFEDGHHVLAHGAAVFTDRLRVEIARLLIHSTNPVPGP